MNIDENIKFHYLYLIHNIFHDQEYNCVMICNDKLLHLLMIYLRIEKNMYFRVMILNLLQEQIEKILISILSKNINIKQNKFLLNMIKNNLNDSEFQPLISDKIFLQEVREKINLKSTYY